ncbi:sensor histidine kinase [Tenacibaculum maritimum]|uniref:Two-component system sensor histidine kinase n=1 Tax=Tenacibaculum maritimum NCIMB 2154 TaxID=1349785 RepID=A0A2H1EDJ8_9FLAO|nr:histidine kinase [Tenacibaculum maritimum]MCD9584221.1 histidine kinase [Tenacibaculum maritimum]MCD9609495.1 histidine kinase [Tenacibaculum maritimum]MCD9619708.1 histidine kinase [Tenacibaculum maritimum]MCD9625910.1 histidine kinase [Tenacibaculum maritimum]MCD9628862.1 histidine kinase [Tenacibaculum maritimum]
MLLDINSAFYSCIRGALLMLFVYHLIIYIQNKDALHKYYTAYLFCLTIYLIRDVFTNEAIQYYYQYISFSMQYVGYFYFVCFSNTLINSKESFPKIYLVVKYLSRGFLAIAFLLIVTQFFLGYEAQKKVVAYSVPFASFCALYVFYMLSKKRTKQIFYLLSGSILFLMLANISSIKMIKGDLYLVAIPVHRMFYYFVGAIIQSTIFAVIIGNYYNEIAERKREVEVSLLKQRNQIARLKMTVLKSQMNPHFLFNSLNSINNFVIQNKIEEASDYIAKFSSLIRNVLQTTNNNTIPLSEELKILSIYIKLEQVRLKDSFSFRQMVDENLSSEDLAVIPFFLQPFVENSIWHGLSLKKGEKKLELEILKEGKSVVARIKDNGIGCEESQRRKLNNLIKRKSFGIQIVEERLKIMYPDEETSIRIQDISDSETTGTEVVIVFPLKYEDSRLL